MKHALNSLAILPEDDTVAMKGTELTPDTFEAEGLLLVRRLMEVAAKDMGTSAVRGNGIDPCRKISTDNIRRARFHLEGMNRAMQENNLMAYNRSLLMLISSLPRPVKGPITATADTMAERLAWEAAFTDAVENALNRALGKIVADDKCLTPYENEIRWLKNNHMNIHPASPEDEIFIKKHMQENGGQFIKAWKVSSPERDSAFREYVRKHAITKTDTLWHGSATVNFISILENGLLISKANYGMFGKGLYFAPSFDKSRGYCSVSGARWRGGTDNSAFLAVVEVATGNSLHTSSNAGHGSRTGLPKGYDSLWAHQGPALARDEVIVYDPSAVRIRYIVETR